LCRHAVLYIEALCLQEPLFDLIIGNVDKAREPVNPDPNWKIATAVVTRAKIQRVKIIKLLKVAEVSCEYSISRNGLAKFQREDETLKKFSVMKVYSVMKDFS